MTEITAEATVPHVEILLQPLTVIEYLIHS